MTKNQDKLLSLNGEDSIYFKEHKSMIVLIKVSLYNEMNEPTQC